MVSERMQKRKSMREFHGSWEAQAHKEIKVGAHIGLLDIKGQIRTIQHLYAIQQREINSFEHAHGSTQNLPKFVKIWPNCQK